MIRLIDLDHNAARTHFLKGSSYFNGDFPPYLNFEIILDRVAEVLGGGSYKTKKKSNPADYENVNYQFTTNKDGRFAWRPYELIHPALYVSLVNTITGEDNWPQICARIQSFQGGIVDCCSLPVASKDRHSDQATQIRSWWQKVEQKSIRYSLEYSHCLNTDVVNCYGALYTHSISWALHGKDVAKTKRRSSDLVGNEIDYHLTQSRYGQTNGIPQGSALMDFIAEFVLGYVDQLIAEKLGETDEFRILRYRDDYRVFSNSDRDAEKVLKCLSDCLQTVGMRLGTSKTDIGTNVIAASIKKDKLAGIDLQDLGIENAKTIQKQLLRLHSFGRSYPNSGSLKRLLGDLHKSIAKKNQLSEDLEEQVAIATDIALVSPATFPAVAGILTHLISLEKGNRKVELWERVHKKMQRVPYNGYLEIWLQRVTKPKEVGIDLASRETICRIVNGEKLSIWNNDWISSVDLLGALDTSKIVVSDPADSKERIEPDEIQIFKELAWMY